MIWGERLEAGDTPREGDLYPSVSGRWHAYNGVRYPTDMYDVASFVRPN
jgi:hypothetical protein